jgi:TatD DNase family protein
VIDTHAHLDACDGTPGEVMARARAAGVHRVLTIGTGIEGGHTAIAIAGAFDDVYAVVGIHPHQAGVDAGQLHRVEELRALLAQPRVVALGEIGLDYFRDYAPHDRQQQLFDEQLDLAVETGLPVVIHTRSADDDTAARLAAHPGTVILHCFSSPGLLDLALGRGFYVSFAGNVTYPAAADLREAAARVPADRLLAETDCPYLSPQPVRGKQNEPAFVMHTLRTLAEVRGEREDELAARIDANAAAAFGLPPLAPPLPAPAA